ncbi:oligosaccharide repeat unit polymerase [Pectobacterium cacticida]|uniref:Oligosaccharide repeat unit polymerase n=1 Tax=Pectobacterium cacticida TaxID=69221 RepID=A0ABZ2G8U6_9GAMM|nr:oligosaccharide repeat unit polymerase [Pectobacterium cacticida]UYX08007.1 oligosaccharide repeat unit polymerase [Pectobacterium cacticida]
MRISFFIFFWYFTFFIIACLGFSNLVDLTTRSIFVFSSILFFYSMGVILAKISPHKKRYLESLLDDHDFSLEDKTEKKIDRFIFLFFGYSVFIVMNIYFFNNFDLDEYRKAFFDGSRDNVKYFGGGFFFYFYYFLSLLLYAITPMVFLFSSRRKFIFLFFCFLLYDIVFLSRTGIYYFLLVYLCSNLVRGKSIIRVVLCGGGVLFIALLISFFRDSVDDIIVSISNSVLNYHIAPFILFDKNIISNQVIHYNGLGMASLGIYNIIMYPFEPDIMKSINDLREQISVFYDLGKFLYQPYNAYYTSLSLIYIDFGLVGCLLLSFFSGFFLFYLYERSKYSKKYAASCVFFAVLLLESLFAPVVINIFSSVIVVYLLLIVFIKLK